MSQVQQGRVTDAQLKFAVCMRAHGVPGFPDPSATGEIGDDGAIPGVNQSSPAYRAAQMACGEFLSAPPAPPSG